MDLFNSPEHLTSLVSQKVAQVLDEIWPAEDPRRPAIYTAQRRISEAVAPELYSGEHFNSEALSKHFRGTNQMHQIPDWSLQHRQSLRQLHLAIFNQEGAGKKLKKRSGDLFDVVPVGVDDLFMATTDFDDTALLLKRVEQLTRLAVKQTLQIQSLSELRALAKRRQMEVHDPAGLTNDYLPKWLKLQKEIEQAMCLEGLKSAVSILNENSFESNDEIWGGMTAAALLDSLFLQFQDGLQAKDLYEVEQKLGVLLQTKKLNPPAFFSFSFKVGVYLPIVAPFVLPILLTVFLILRGKLAKLLGLNKKEKEKTD